MPEPESRAVVAAAKRTRQRRGFWVHVAVYVAINTVLTANWALGGRGFFWPVFLMTVWGAGVLVNAYIAYGPHRVSVGRS